jgi:hypothetical protein
LAQIILKNNEFINILELSNISKKVFILFIKDLINIIIFNKNLSIEEGLIKLQKGILINNFITSSSILLNKTRFLNNSVSLKLTKNDLKRFKQNNQLLIKLINSTNLESLNKKRTRLSKTFFNKSLLAKLTNKINIHNNTISNIIKPKLNSKKFIVSNKELVGKGLLLKPVNKQKLNNLFTLSNIDLSDDYKKILN